MGMIRFFKNLFAVGRLDENVAQKSVSSKIQDLSPTPIHLVLKIWI